MTTGKRATTTRGRATAARRRRTTSATHRTRRRTPGVASTVGTAVGTLVVTTLLDGSWPVRAGLVLLAVLLVGGYFVLGARNEAAHESPAPEPTTTPTQTPKDPA